MNKNLELDQRDTPLIKEIKRCLKLGAAKAVFTDKLYANDVRKLSEIYNIATFLISRPSKVLYNCMHPEDRVYVHEREDGYNVIKEGDMDDVIDLTHSNHVYEMCKNHSYNTDIIVVSYTDMSIEDIDEETEAITREIEEHKIEE